MTGEGVRHGPERGRRLGGSEGSMEQPSRSVPQSSGVRSVRQLSNPERGRWVGGWM